MAATPGCTAAPGVSVLSTWPELEGGLGVGRAPASSGSSRMPTLDLRACVCVCVRCVCVHVYVYVCTCACDCVRVRVHAVCAGQPAVTR